MSKFLLDANLSPRVAKFLKQTLDLDVTSLQGQRLGELPDQAVIALAREQDRVIITLDRDFNAYFRSARREPVGVIWLDLPRQLRFIPSINQLLERFFREQAASIDLDHSLVILTADAIVIHRHDHLTD